MTDLDNILEIKRELAKCIGSFFFVTTSIDFDSPIHYPLWVTCQRSMTLLDDLEKSINMEVLKRDFH